MIEFCDVCEGLLHRDSNGYWVGADDASDCPESDEGHTVNGFVR